MKNYLKKVLSVQSESYNQFRTFAFVIRELKRLSIDFYVSDGCIYATKGDSENFPCIVSHLDTVHDIEKGFEVLESKGNFFAINSNMEQVGVGGDDKVGIFICLSLLAVKENLKAVFFRDEEVGCVGSYSADMEFFKDCGYVLQCDRKGYGDFVTDISGCVLSSKDFKKDVKTTCKNYGFKFVNGGMTDVLALHENNIGVSVANISCGYYNPHTFNEYVNINDVLNTLSFVNDLIDTLGETKYKHKGSNGSFYKRYSYKKFDSFIDTAINSTFKSWAGYKDTTVKNITCDCCMFESKHKADFVPVQGMTICLDCYEELNNQ